MKKKRMIEEESNQTNRCDIMNKESVVNIWIEIDSNHSPMVFPIHTLTHTFDP